MINISLRPFVKSAFFGFGMGLTCYATTKSKAESVGNSPLIVKATQEVADHKILVEIGNSFNSIKSFDIGPRYEKDCRALFVFPYGVFNSETKTIEPAESIVMEPGFVESKQITKANLEAVQYIFAHLYGEIPDFTTECGSQNPCTRIRTKFSPTHFSKKFFDELTQANTKWVKEEVRTGEYGFFSRVCCQKDVRQASKDVKYYSGLIQILHVLGQQFLEHRDPSLPPLTVNPVLEMYLKGFSPSTSIESNGAVAIRLREYAAPLFITPNGSFYPSSLAMGRNMPVSRGLKENDNTLQLRMNTVIRSMFQISEKDNIELIKPVQTLPYLSGYNRNGDPDFFSRVSFPFQGLMVDLNGKKLPKPISRDIEENSLKEDNERFGEWWEVNRNSVMRHALSKIPEL